MPSELTPATRRRPGGTSQARSSVLTKNGDAAKSMSGLGSPKLRLGGICRCRSDSTVLMRPVAPAAAPRWPMLVFTEPIGTYWRCSVVPNALVRAATSMGSPSGVAVPCAST